MEYVLRTSLHQGTVVRVDLGSGFLCVPGVREYYFSNGQPQAPEIMKATETTSCLARWCCLSNRCMTIELRQGETGQGPLIARFERPWCCPMAPGKCCFQQRMWAYDADGKDLGGVKETTCWRGIPKVMFLIFPPSFSRDVLCVSNACVHAILQTIFLTLVFGPQMDIQTADGTVEYTMKQPTCCCGHMVDRCGLGLGKCLGGWQPPVGFYDASSDTEKGRVTNLVRLMMSGGMYKSS
jgi:hypothetical protein